MRVTVDEKEARRVCFVDVSVEVEIRTKGHVRGIDGEDRTSDKHQQERAAAAGAAK